MNLLSLAAAIILLPFSLCSCGVYEMATAPQGDEADMDAACMLICPPLLITGTRTLPYNLPERNLSSDAQLIRNRNRGRLTESESQNIHAAMEDAFQLSTVQHMNEKQITDLFGPPDRRETIAGRTVFYYRVASPRGTYKDVPLLLEPQPAKVTGSNCRDDATINSARSGRQGQTDPSTSPG